MKFLLLFNDCSGREINEQKKTIKANVLFPMFVRSTVAVAVCVFVCVWRQRDITFKMLKIHTFDGINVNKRHAIQTKEE